MNNFTAILTGLQAAIAVVSARDRSLTALLVAVWGRIGRIRARIQRLVALWRAGTLPPPRPSQAGMARVRVRAKSVYPTTPSWLLDLVRDATSARSQLEHLLSEAEWVEFLAAVPQAGRILRPLCRMLGIGVAARKPRPPGKLWEAAPARVPAGLVVGPEGRLRYV